MVIVFQLLLYAAFVAALILFLLFSWVGGHSPFYRRGILFGLIASPLGFVLPYVVLMGLEALCRGNWPFDGVPIIDVSARLFVGVLFALGPILGPPLMVLLVARRVIKHPTTKATL